ncbi:phosphatidylserine decarboxylase family protein [Candidatus Binatia bacterium]|nr:phosphatidylserine decarboxylase family protein [Candidatus Binatia bacterium]
MADERPPRRQEQELTATNSARGWRVPIARDGLHSIAAAALATAVLYVLGWTVAASVAAAATVFAVSFFRDPERNCPADPRLILAPADGRIIKMGTVRDERFLHTDATIVSIFMSPLNVHVNRAPVSGRVLDVHHHPGKYFRAFADKASLDNEQTAVLLEDDAGRRLCCVQIAGFVARRIVCRLRPGDRVEQGSRYGMIKFGSRADVYLPRAARVRVAVGDRAVAGETVLAEWP